MNIVEHVSLWYNGASEFQDSQGYTEKPYLEPSPKNPPQNGGHHEIYRQMDGNKKMSS